jgi:hypothetical protein
LPVITHTGAPKSGYPYSAPILSLKLAAAVQASPFIEDLPIEDFGALREKSMVGKRFKPCDETWGLVLFEMSPSTELLAYAALALVAYAVALLLLWLWL